MRNLIRKIILSGAPVLLKGAPGVGKTYLLEQAAKEVGGKFFYLLAHQWMSEEDFMFKFDPSSGQREDGILPTIAKESCRRKVFLLADELDKARQPIDNLFLDFLQNWRVQDAAGNMVYACRENLFIGFTSNDVRPISEPLMRRLQVFTLPWLPKEVEVGLLQEKISSLGVDIPDGFIEAIWKIIVWVRQNSDNKRGDIKSLLDLVSLASSCVSTREEAKLLLKEFFTSKFEVELPKKELLNSFAGLLLYLARRK